MDELIRGLKAGRPEAFERLVREFGDRIYRFVKRLSGERQAEDLTQEVFIRVHRSIDAYRPEGRFESWLFTIANNLCIDHSRWRRDHPAAAVQEIAEMTGCPLNTALGRMHYAMEALRKSLKAYGMQ